MADNHREEFVVRVPSNTKKQFHVMRFSSALKVDVTQLRNCKLEREVIFKESKDQPQEELPEFGAGSEYRRKEKEEARRRKFEKRKSKTNNSPWILKVGGKQGKKYRGIREGGVTENASYYVFFKAADGVFEAFPVNEWYNFTPFQRYKVLSAEEAEEKFIKRDQILNFFQFRNMAKKGAGDKDESFKKDDKKIKKDFKVSDMDDWDVSGNEYSGEESEEDFKQRKVKKEKKIKKEENSEEEPVEDSDEGDYDDKEVDYMSDKSSSMESEEEKDNLKGVEDESALRDLVVSEEEDEEENKNENSEPNEEQSKFDLDKNSKFKNEKKSNDSFSESDFDSENSDLEDSKSALLIQKSQAKNIKIKQEQPETKVTESTKRKLDNVESSNSAKTDKPNGLIFRHKLDVPIEPTNKKLKVRHDHGITEEAVRRYLIRKPMTAADLVQKFKNKTTQKDKLPDLLAEILRKINPEKQNIKGKMYFSLKPT